MNINHGKQLVPVSIERVEQSTGGKFLMETTYIFKDGKKTDQLCQLYYQPNPDVSKGHTHYFVIYIQSNLHAEHHVMIAEPGKTHEGVFTGLSTEDGVIISRHSHDYRTHKNHFIDGGRFYTRCSVDAPLVSFEIVDGEFQIVKENKNDQVH